MIRNLIAAVLVLAAIVLYIMDEAGFAGLVIAGLACEMGAIAIATRSPKPTAE